MERLKILNWMGENLRNLIIFSELTNWLVDWLTTNLLNIQQINLLINWQTKQQTDSTK